MRVTVLLFGPQASLARARELVVEPAEPTAAAVLDAVGATEPKLRPSLAASRLAINHEFAPAADTPVTPGDELALIGLVSGG